METCTWRMTQQYSSSCASIFRGIYTTRKSGSTLREPGRAGASALLSKNQACLGTYFLYPRISFHCQRKRLTGLLILPEKLSLPTLLGTDKLDELVQFRFDWVDPEKAPLQFDLTQSQTMKLRVVRKTETTIKLSQSSVQCDPDAKPIYVEYDVNMVLRPGDVKFESGGARISVYFSMADGRPLFLESAVNTHDIDLSEESLNDGTVTLTTKVGVTLTTKMDSPGFLRLLTAPHYTLRQDVPIKHSRKEYDWATKIIGRT
eukprot:GHVS01050201.1.p1 GENE.GHVS01050201.1~~GHVS01050201.1.p1  ORF type:complete len:260 (-),score=-3.36 GHVS01050201.1:219-998(-)